MGFMDEEVSDILRFLIILAKSEKRPVLIIERGIPETLSQRLFERAVSNYPIEPGSISVTLLDEQQTAQTSPQAFGWPERELAQHLDSASFKQRRWHRAAYAAREVKVTGKLCLVRITPAGGVQSGEPLILVRSPEMGLQPDLTRMYLRAVFKALGAHGFSDVEISCFGAGGAAAEDLKPGSWHDVNGSFYVGVAAEKDDIALDKMERDFEDYLVPSGADADRYIKDNSKFFYGVVKLIFNSVPRDVAPLWWATTKDKQDFLLFRTTERYRYDDAVNIAQQAFGKLCGKLVNPAPSAIREDSNRETAALDSQMAARAQSLRLMLGQFPKYTVNLTGSFFIGADVKAAARDVNVGEVNMEDYHVLRALNAITADKNGKYGGMRTRSVVSRVHCDPPEITSALEGQFSAWAQSASYTPEQFKSAIQWGLDGCRLDKLTPQDHWLFADTIGRDDRVVYSCKATDVRFKGYVLDPFFSEIASDFLATLQGGVAKQAFVGTGMKTAVWNSLAEEAAAVLKDPVQNADKIDTILTAICNGASFDGGVSPFRAGSGRIRIWVRPGKWPNSSGKGVEAVVINHTSLQWSGASVDRALYKSTNQVVLQEMARGRVES
jgi:hypothetical protein